MSERTTVARLLARVAVVVVILFAGVSQLRAQVPNSVPRALKERAAEIVAKRAKRITNADRLAAAERAKPSGTEELTSATRSPVFRTLAVPAQGGAPNYFGPESNWANSPMPTVDPTTGAISGGIQKFVDSLPQLGRTGANDLNQYLSVAVKDITTYPGCDYYEIALVQYTQKMHTDLNPTTLRGYVQLETPANASVSLHVPLSYPDGTPILDANGIQVLGVDPPSYLGPSIVATKDVPVRVKFTNYLPTGAGGDLFLPVDTTEMGAGMGPLGMNTSPGAPMNYTQNRGTLHLHGGATPWISDGTPHQWITPAGELTDYPKGVSVKNVPDMPDPGPGSMTFFYSNQQSARLMFYHDHAYGITRLNVYAGEAAGYVLTDPTEQDLIARGVLPDIGIPLIIQDKTFIDPAKLLANDPTWPFAIDATKSDLWYPHVYMTNQNPNDPAGANALGRWDYGPWFWPPWVANSPPITLPNGTVMPNLPNLSMTMEAFHDTPLVNGTVYPYMTVDPKTYRFRILNAANDRMWNLQLYVATSVVGGVTLTSPGSGYADAPLVTIAPAPGDTTGHGGSATATVDLTVGSPTYGQVTGLALFTVGSGYTLPPVVTIAPPPVGGTPATATASLYTGNAEVGMVPALAGMAPFPSAWTAQTTGQPGDILDGRTGGVPDPTLIGPSMVQIGTEGGFLPAPVVWQNVPLGYNRNPKDITVTNVLEHNLFMGPAERADVLIDFSQFAGKTIILYNDAPAAVPAADSRNDYYTGDLDQTAIGGAPTTLPGYGPNTRTILQFRVANTAPAAAYNLAGLQAEFATNPVTGAPGVFARSQDPIIVPQAPYNSAYNGNFPADTTAYARIQSTSLTFTPLGAAAPITLPMKAKAIHELFENDYGRMNAVLGVELPFTNGLNQTTLPFGYIDPPTEYIDDSVTIGQVATATDGTQIWKITHNGVDTHPIHFHLFNVQVINRVGWDGMVKPPEPNELGWRETVRMNPLEDCIVAFRAVSAKTPFGVPDSIRPLDPAMPIGDTANFAPWDPQGNPVTTQNQIFNFGWEYVWHCHILSHEEMDMMRPIVFNVPRALATAPILNGALVANQPVLTWTDATPANPAYPTAGTNWGNPQNEVGFRIERARGNGVFAPIATSLANSTTFTDTTAAGGTFNYRVVAYNAAGDSISNVVQFTTPGPAGPAAPAPPTNLTATLQTGPQVVLNWTDNSNNEANFEVERSTNGGGFVLIASPPAVPGLGPATYTDATVQAGSNYAYRVRAVNTGGNSAYTNTATVVVPPIPAAPTNLTGALQAGPQVALSWTDNATNETNFEVERSTNGGAFTLIASPAALAGTGTVNYTDTTVLPGNSYDYRVRAANLGGWSAYTNTVTVAVPAIPTAPTNLTANLLPGLQVAIGWTDNATNEANFQLERSTNGGAFTLIASPAAIAGTGPGSYTDATVLPGNTYDYRLRAVNIGGASAYTNTATVAVPAIPAAPTGLAVVLQNGPQAVLTWTDNATNEANFEVQRSTNGGAFTLIASPAALAGTGTLTYTDTTVLPGNTYVYQVRAVNLGGNSAYSNTVTAAVPAIPAAPTGLTAALQLGPQAVLSWIDNATSEANFEVERSTNGGAFVLIATPAANPGTGTATYTDLTVLPNNTYAYRVRAVNVSAASAYTNTATVSVPAAPAAPTSLVAVLQNGPRIALTWRDNATNETGFQLERSTNGGAFVAITTVGRRAGTGNVTFTDVTALPGNTYAYRVTAINSVVLSAYSNTATVVIPALPAPPTNLTATLAANLKSAALTWTDNSNNEQGFIIWRSTNGGTTWTQVGQVVANVVTFNNTGLQRRTTYLYRVQAYYQYGASAFTNTVTVIVP